MKNQFLVVASLALLLLGGAYGQTTVNGSTVTVAGIEVTANKDAASGYAGLDGSTLLKTAEMPAHTGDATSSAGSMALTVIKINGVSLAGLGTGILKNTTGTGAPSIAVAADVTGLFSSCSGTQYLGADGACHTAGIGTVTSVSGTTNQIGSTGGATPVVSLSSTVVLPGTEAHKVTTVSFSATPTFDGSLSDAYELTLTGNVTSSTWSNHTAGFWKSLKLCQDGTGNRSFVWPTTVLGVSDTGRTASKCSMFLFYDDGTNLYSAGVPQYNM